MRDFPYVTGESPDCLDAETFASTPDTKPRGGPAGLVDLRAP